MSREAMQLALELIEPIAHNSTDDPRGKAYEAITALRQALEQPAQQEVDWEKLYRLEVKKKEELAAKYERDTSKQLTRIVPMNQPAQQEPVAWANSFDLQNFDMKVRTGPDLHHTVPLYTAPPKKEWVVLTGDEARKFYEKYTDREELIHAIDKFLEEKNNG